MAKSRVANPFEDTTRMAPAPGPQAGEGNAAYLVVLAGSNVGEMYKVEKDRTVMGRGESVDIRLFDEGISREHAQVVQEKIEGGTQSVLEDMGSTNGTFCNGARVQRQILAEGDKILLGSTTILKFSYQDKLDEMFQRQMSESALRDGLTKAFNKRYFTERVESEYLYAVRHDTPVSLMFIDIDHFKRINDVHGHPAGDYVLVELAKLAHGCLRNEDIFSRYGGEEFAVISRGTDLAEAQSLAERLRRAVEDYAFSFEGKSISVTISVGIARAPRADVASPAELVAVADETMYTAKRSGRNRVCVAGATPKP
ncbi:MAG TPA: GGDEF domain-containing protein [Polyangia bacterium]|jgi:two-component system cell cycle response regulator|nr:GGDEF domain-containing protein [Polyangia bacterium]